MQISDPGLPKEPAIFPWSAFIASSLCTACLYEIVVFCLTIICSDAGYANCAWA